MSSKQAKYAELHCKSFYSFGQGASHVHELLAKASEYGYPALALTDTNLCGALEFARLANSLGIKPISGCELTLTDESRLTLLARTRKGYGNISRLLTLANGHDRREPRLDPAYLPAHTEGTVLLAGGRDSLLSNLVQRRRQFQALEQTRQYMEWYGPDGVYIELQQNFLYGDTKRNRRLINLAHDCGVSVVATNDALYHAPERYRLQHALVAASHNNTIDRALRYIRANDQSCLKSAERMRRLFRHCPEALDNTLRIADSCDFNLDTDLGYRLPDADVPAGYTSQTYLERLCYEAALRRYGEISHKVQARLREEFRLIELHGMAGFLLLYREIALIARDIMLERGLVSPEVPLEARPPGSGRGSSVALLVGYLIGISHIDPLAWDLSLERFISEEVRTLPDIDLDFPRSIRDALIERVHQRFGSEHAVLAGAIGTYRLKGVIQDMGNALGLPREQLKLLSKQGLSGDAKTMGEEMRQMPGFRDRVDAPGWSTLVELAPQLMGALTGLPAVSLAPAAGAQGELAGVLMITRALEDRGELATRRRILVPDSAHGTNPATAAMAGFTVTHVPTAADGSLDRAIIEQELDETVAAVMVTVPNTLGLWERGIEEIAALIHDAGAYLYGDGANLNAIVGRVRYGDLGFDVVHLNLHKTFSTPHGGGGPGAGPVCCTDALAPYLPTPVVEEDDDGLVGLAAPERSIGRLQQFHGNVGVLIRAYAYLRALGLEGLRAVSGQAVLNANYLRVLLGSS